MGATEVWQTGTDELLGELRDGVLCLCFNRPEARNALSDTLSPALRRAITDADGDQRVRCLMLTGKGAAFCAGGDVKAMGSRGIGTPTTPEEKVEELTRRQETLTGALHRLRIPTLAALPGPAVGAGFSIALACDLRIAARSAFVSTAYARIGLSGDYGMSWFLSRLVGPAKAKELFFSAERIPAEAAVALGILNRVVDDDALELEAWDWARRLAAGPTVAFGYMKDNFARAESDLSASLRQEAIGILRSAATQDHKEAVRSFVEKREPTFTGE
jgi:enoyl-CoA hydratase/carnithine racemase